MRIGWNPGNTSGAFVVGQDNGLSSRTRTGEQIAATLSNHFDHRLVFGPMNEPRLRGHERERWYGDS